MQRRPTIDKIDAGEQHVLPGAERITDRELVERRMRGRLAPTKPQKPADEGLFGRPDTTSKLL